MGACLNALHVPMRMLRVLTDGVKNRRRRTRRPGITEAVTGSSEEGEEEGWIERMVEEKVAGSVERLLAKRGGKGSGSVERLLAKRGGGGLESNGEEGKEEGEEGG